ncbi:hypothetical protein OCK74_14480 [Chitinophagaceae bacterium LB-8]|uniref:Uncharacterized protein n=1 Tax=Paraflavisolibacter caeni TaxID=2982496 RepID=A0A9X3B887_9BACT|nr:hypothetical protein [Paraflavisolibacter caeni]MCU7550325.1 hypothetical protein [Paraflavisolibacter caeni]
MKRSTTITTVQSKMNLSEAIMQKLVDSQAEEIDFNPFFTEYKKARYKSTEGITEGIIEMTFISDNYNKLNRISIPVEGCFLFTCVKSRFGFIKAIWSTSLN